MSVILLFQSDWATIGTPRQIVEIFTDKWRIASDKRTVVGKTACSGHSADITGQDRARFFPAAKCGSYAVCDLNVTSGGAIC